MSDEKCLNIPINKRYYSVTKGFFIREHVFVDISV